MSDTNNSALGPPPLATPITADQLDEIGIPYQMRAAQGGVPKSNLHVSWGAWFNKLGEHLNQISVVIRDTAANMASYPPQNYPPYPIYQQTDRGDVEYIGRPTAGTVTTAGTAVTWISGDMFSSALVGGQITINGALFTVSAVGSAIGLTLSATAGAHAGVAYSTQIIEWRYLSGKWTDIFANLPTLGAADIGLKFFDTTHWRLFEWATVGAGPSSTSPGWKRGAQELPKGALQVLPFAGGQMATGWAICDGTNADITEDDATIVTVATPNTVGAYLKGGAYSPTRHAESGQTDPAVTGITVSGGGSPTPSFGSVNAGTGAPATFVTNITGGGGGGAVTDPGHFHTAGNIEPPNVVVPFYMKR